MLSFHEIIQKPMEIMEVPSQYHPSRVSSKGSPPSPRVPVVHRALLWQLRAPEAHGEAQGAPELAAEVAGRFLTAAWGEIYFVGPFELLYIGI